MLRRALLTARLSPSEGPPDAFHVHGLEVKEGAERVRGDHHGHRRCRLPREGLVLIESQG